MKTRTKMILGFTTEIIFFVMTGVHIVTGKYYYVAISLVIAMIAAGITGKLLEKDVIEKYKKEELK